MSRYKDSKFGQALAPVLETMNTLGKLSESLSEAEMRSIASADVRPKALPELLDEMLMLGALSLRDELTDAAADLVDMRCKAVREEVRARLHTATVRFGHEACDLMNGKL